MLFISHQYLYNDCYRSEHYIRSLSYLTYIGINAPSGEFKHAVELLNYYRYMLLIC